MKHVRLLPVVISMLLLAGCASYHVREGNRLYDAMAYNSAATEYQKALAKKEFPEARMKLADSYRLMNNTAKAEEAYANVASMPDAPPQYKLYYAQALMQNGKYEEAKKQFDEYLVKMPNDQAVQMLRQSIDSIPALMEDSAKYTVEPLSINTGESNFASTYYEDGIVFVSDRSAAKRARTYEWTGRPFLDLYFSKKNGTTWDAPTLLQGDMNGVYHDGPATFSADGNTMYFSRNNYLKKKAEKSEADVVNIKTYKAEKKDGLWKNVQELPFNSDEYSVGHPSLSADGNSLFLISDMPGGSGGTDIYLSKWVNGNWGKPENMGAVINTPFNEMFPNIYADTLYFSSMGHVNMGGLDVFYSINNNGTWSQARNLGYPINSSRDDFGLVLKADSGLLSSNRNAAGLDNLYQFTRNDLRFKLLGTVVDKDTKQPIEGAMVTLDNKVTGLKDSVLSDGNGFFTFMLNRETDYDVRATNDQYFSNTEAVTTVGRKTSGDLVVKLLMELTHIVINKAYTLENIYYDLDKSEIRSDAAVGLDSLVYILRDNPGIKIELSSHTDSRADDNYNMRLSERRAQSAVNYIITKGIAKERMRAKGYGESKLINRCSNGVACTEEEHQLNRRTEFKVVEAFGMEKDASSKYVMMEETNEGGKKAAKSDEKAYLTIQIKASLTPVNLKEPPYAGVEGIMSDREEKGYSRYSVGRFYSLADANRKLDELRAKGFKDAFVTGRKGNRVLSVKEALQQMPK